MTDFWSKVIPIIIVFFLGFALKKIRLFSSSTADTLLRISFYVTLPSLTFLSGATAELNLKFILLPFVAIVTMLLIGLISAPIAKLFKMPPATHGAFYVGTLIMNTGFTLPFVLAAFGNQGLAIYTIFDFGNSLMIFTFAYYFAIKYGNQKGSKIPIKKFLLLPPIWGLILGVVFNLLKIELSATHVNFFEIVGRPTIFLIIFSLGLYFHPHIFNLGKMFTVFGLRIGVGMFLGWAFAAVLGFEGIIKTLVIVFCGAPVGYNTLIFSSLEGLDKEFAASLVSISLLLGIIYVPLLLFWV
ncbi:MAG: AEC family transporter [Candidatus Cloacimonetes bacterium]|nr:AEC family transporter [Candidatus Cloacimonadota bacterium]MCF7815342.1 AEC family transporter [Candidatus Cloacimonadota bacterium]MCF7867757.1 AEC family transporter [Candidatus Cloacimonadota bacterium]MCF7883157.1 AEC family transporter [Candidatus Cloacimonadota bacterium]